MSGVIAASDSAGNLVIQEEILRRNPSTAANHESKHTFLHVFALKRSVPRPACWFIGSFFPAFGPAFVAELTGFRFFFAGYVI